MESLRMATDARKPCKLAVVFTKTLGEGLGEEVCEYVGVREGVEPFKRKAKGIAGIL
jgi:hypothetical protein